MNVRLGKVNFGQPFRVVSCLEAIRWATSYRGSAQHPPRSQQRRYCYPFASERFASPLPPSASLALCFRALREALRRPTRPGDAHTATLHTVCNVGVSRRQRVNVDIGHRGSVSGRADRDKTTRIEVTFDTGGKFNTGGKFDVLLTEISRTQPTVCSFTSHFGY